MSSKRPCGATKADGTPCHAAALPGSQWCVFHDPDHKTRREAGRRQGGKVRSHKAAVLSADAADVELITVSDVAKFLAATISQVRRGELDPKPANAIACLVGHLLHAIQGSCLEERVAKLEANDRDNDWDSQPPRGGPGKTTPGSGFVNGSAAVENPSRSGEGHVRSGDETG
jgi:hypothetical protein